MASVDIAGAPGWIAVHMDQDGAPGPVVGFVDVPEGQSTDVVVQFDTPVANGDYWPMLHVDDGEVGTYVFPQVDGADLPVKDGQDVVMQMITLTVG